MGEKLEYNWQLGEVALEIIGRINPITSVIDGHTTLEPELLKLNENLAALIVEVDGADYALTLQRIPTRKRPQAEGAKL